MHEYAQDAMTQVRAHVCSDLFITFACHRRSRIIAFFLQMHSCFPIVDNMEYGTAIDW